MGFANPIAKKAIFLVIISMLVRNVTLAVNHAGLILSYANPVLMTGC